ncbi:hypothetical protein ACFOOP_13765 [Marinicaulis aureus]|uniref:Lipoprotein n=1 Tax=Hyphococcus aureus TaxID=2666033 RepID=A0ABW1L0W0_9PROT
MKLRLFSILLTLSLVACSKSDKQTLVDKIEVLKLTGQCKESHSEQFAEYFGELVLVSHTDGKEIVSAHVDRYGADGWESNFEESIAEPTKYFPPNSIVLHANKNDFKPGIVKLLGYSERCADIDCNQQINFHSECELMASYSEPSESDDI